MDDLITTSGLYKLLDGTTDELTNNQQLREIAYDKTIGSLKYRDSLGDVHAFSNTVMSMKDVVINDVKNGHILSYEDGVFKNTPLTGGSEGSYGRVNIADGTPNKGWEETRIKIFDTVIESDAGTPLAITSDTSVSLDSDEVYLNGTTYQLGPLKLNTTATQGNEAVQLQQISRLVTNVTSQETITITHSMIHDYPVVTVLDSANNQIEADVEYISSTQVKVSFTNNFTGRIILS